MSGGHWYGKVCSDSPDVARGVVQMDSVFREANRNSRSVRFPEHVLRLAQAEYERQYGHQQDYERMQERGGLSVLEVVGLLADYVERLGGKPTEPRKPKS